MRTADAVSPLAASQVLATLVGFILVYGLLGLADFYLLFKIRPPRPRPAAGEEGDMLETIWFCSGASSGPSTSCSTASTSASAR